MSQTQRRSDDNKVICPRCVHEFAAIPVNVQEELSVAREKLEAERELSSQLMVVARSASRLINSSAWAGVSDEDIELEQAVKWFLSRTTAQTTQNADPQVSSRKQIPEISGKRPAESAPAAESNFDKEALIKKVEEVFRWPAHRQYIDTHRNGEPPLPTAESKRGEGKQAQSSALESLAGYEVVEEFAAHDGSTDKDQWVDRTLTWLCPGERVVLVKKQHKRTEGAER